MSAGFLPENHTDTFCHRRKVTLEIRWHEVVSAGKTACSIIDFIERGFNRTEPLTTGWLGRGFVVPERESLLTIRQDCFMF